MELRHFRYFIAVAERLNFTAAARHLKMAQPPLSIQIRNLEEELGCPLFIRENRRVELTPAGRIFLEEAREILTKTENATRRVQDESAGRAGEITLAYTDGALSEKVTRQLRKFRRKTRGLHWTLRRINYGSALTLDGVDSILTDFSVEEMPPTAVALERSTLQVAIPPKHRLADRESFTPSDLIGETLISSPYDLRTPAEKILMARLEADNIAHAVEIGGDHLQHRFWQVSVGLGSCFCTSSDRGALDARRVPLAGTHQETVITLLPNPNSRSAALPALMEALRS